MSLSTKSPFAFMTSKHSKRIGFIFFTATMLFLASYFVGSQAAAKSPSRAMLILDGSGSMWGRLDGKPKISILRDRLKKAILGLTSKPALGLMAFGHRQKGNCRDVERLAAVAPLKPAAFIKLARSVSPKGKTPMSLALGEAAKGLNLDGRPARIILVTDGFENCRQDPCKLAKALKSRSRRLRIDVIGFGDSEAELKKLSCLTKTTGGVLMRARNGTELQAALGKAFTSGAAQRTAAAQMVPLRQRTEAGLRLSALLKEGGTPIKAGLSWRVYAAGSATGAKAEPVAQSDDGLADLKLPAGSYRVVATYGDVLGEQIVDVSKDGITPVQLVLNAGAIRLRATATSGGAPLDDVSFEILDHQAAAGSAPLYTHLGREMARRLRAGTYKAVAQVGLGRVERAISLKPGEAKDIALTMDLGKLQLTAVDSANGSAAKDVFYTVYKKNGAHELQGAEIARTAQIAPLLHLPAGTYEVLAQSGLARTITPVIIAAGGLTRKELNLKVGSLKLSAKLAGSGTILRDNVSYQIFTADARRSLLHRTSRPIAEFRLSAGRYHIVGRLSHLNVVTQKTVDIVPGKSINLVLAHKAGTAAFVLLNKAGGVPLTGVVWRIFNGAGDEIWRTNRARPRFTLAEGNYKAIGEYNGKTVTQPFSLSSGAKKTLEIVAQ